MNSVLGVGVCIGLDHLYFCRGNDPLKGEYFFSDKITKRDNGKTVTLETPQNNKD